MVVEAEESNVKRNARDLRAKAGFLALLRAHAAQRRPSIKSITPILQEEGSGSRHMHFKPATILKEVILIEPELFKDARGYFTEMYHRKKFEEAGIKGDFVQDNRSRSRQETIRGLHYQVKRPQGKLVWVLYGEVFDVAVDIRRGSPTFGKWEGTLLSSDNKKGIYIPPHFAHGFCVLSDEAEMFYKCTEFYSPEDERTIRWDDPELAIDWPIENPILSEKDATAPFFKEAQLPP